MLKYIVAYAAVLLIIGVYDSFKVKSFEDFAVAGKSQGYAPVLLSLMATMLGASATLGVAERAGAIGFPAFWWLAAGAVGLWLQAALLSQKVRDLNANTLPDIAGITVGNMGKTITALVIVLAWPGIIAAQFVAMGQVLTLFTAGVDYPLLLPGVALAAIIYTMVGGQLSVIKTDSIQFMIIGSGLIFCLAYLFWGAGGGDGAQVWTGIELLNRDFGPGDLAAQLFIVGGAYFLGPDILSRNLVSKDGATAKKAARHAGLLLIIFSAVITLIGMWAQPNLNDSTAANPFIYIITNHLPFPLDLLLAVGLISALLSSADTCLVNAASIIESDILKRHSVNETRGFVAMLGIVSLIIALYRPDIIALLTAAYSVYVPGIVFPLFFAIWFYKKRRLNKKLWLAAVAVGGVSGLLSLYPAAPAALSSLPLAGMAAALIFSILSVWDGQ
ncbi:MAG: sodium:solute symporter family protein [Syntrophomonadaceae bacterium]|nr:sodium:solute symporter family protein [Syntrophomonadaceae bacterium]